MPLKHSVEELVLNNGARGLLIDVPDSTVVSYDIHFRAGNYYAPSLAKQQTAHIMEHMVFGATKNYPSIEAFSQEFTKNGAYNNATTWQYNMSYYADCALMEWDRILDLQRQAITEPVFTQELLEAEKGNVTEELTGRANHHGRVLWQALYKAMGDAGFNDTEKLETIPAVSLDDIKSHHAKTHTIQNLRFAIAGNLALHKDEIIKQLEGWELPQGKRLLIPTEPLHTAEPVHIYRKDLPSIIFAFSIVLNRQLSEDEQMALSAINHILTGTFHSRIWGRARNRGICYGMGSDVSVDTDGISRWEFSGQIRPQNAPEMFTLIADQLQKVAEGDISEKELTEAKEYALGGYQMRGQTVRSLSGWYASDYFDKDKISPMEAIPDEIKGVTTALITAISKEFLTDGVWGIGAIGDIEEQAVAKLADIVSPLFLNEVQ
jgi:predicted Zn-dependent peptidase